jgi:predicted MFS family arabinose efflux permease
MAVLGIPIGASFVVGIIGGPILAGFFGTAFLFVLTGCLGLLIDFLLVSYLPDVPSSSEPPAPLTEVLKIRPLLYLSAGGFLMNFFMSSFFFHFPLIVTGQLHLKMTEYYRLLLPMMIISGITMFAFSRGADRGWGRSLSALAFFTFFPSVVLLFHSEFAGFDPSHLTGVLIAGTLFYVGFTGLEPVLPSLVSKHSPESAYGTALGFYNSAQFLGSPAGSSLSGALSTSHVVVTLLCASVLGMVLMALQPSR